MTDGPGWTPPEQGADPLGQAQPGSWPPPQPPPGPGSWQQPPGPGPWQGPGYGQAPPQGPGLPSWPPPGYGGYGAPWPPPAPKPGVIPLRPIGLGELIDGSITTIRRNPKATLGFTAAIMAVSTVITTVLTAGAMPSMQRFSERTDAGQPLRASDIAPMIGWLATVGVVSLVLALAVSVILTGILTAVVGRAVLGQNITAGQAWQQARGRVGALIGLILLMLAIFVGLWVVLIGGATLGAAAASGPGSGGAAAAIAVPLIIAAIPLTIFLWVKTSLAAPVVVLERASPTSAIGRSWRLTRKSFWRVFGIWLVTYFGTAVAGLVLEVPFRLLQSALTGSSGFGFTTPSSSLTGGRLLVYLIIGGVGGLVAATVTRPLLAGVAVLLYVDLRMRREGLDMALQTAAAHEQAPGDEFASVWRPPSSGSWRTPGSWQSGPGQGQGGPWPSGPGASPSGPGPWPSGPGASPSGPETTPWPGPPQAAPEPASPHGPPQAPGPRQGAPAPWFAEGGPRPGQAPDEGSEAENGQPPPPGQNTPPW
jgi:hypothetical protein